ncbi:hypothetical protein GQ600_17918 [Phytophthora cactorum]|nr:hypothetical protein GQ600_17918 [Phytophthora cactorum]
MVCSWCGVGSQSDASQGPQMCGTNDAVCLHGDCVVEAVNGAAYERCQCYTMYSGSQCSFRGELLYWELPVACALMLILLALVSSTLEWLRFQQAKRDPLRFRETGRMHQGYHLELSYCVANGRDQRERDCRPNRLRATLRRTLSSYSLSSWSSCRGYNCSTGVLTVVPWPKKSRRIAEILRISLLYPLWSHLEPSQFPRFMLYLSLGFVPGVLLIACLLGVKRFPLFKPQPKNSPTEDVCTLVLRLYCEWLALPIMIGLLLPLECGVIGYNKVMARQ